MKACECSPVVLTATGLFQLVICLAFTIAGYCAPYWAHYTLSSRDVHFGLWATCVNGHCVSLPDSWVTSKARAARALGVLGMTAALTAIMAAIVFLLRRKAVCLTAAASLSAVTFMMVMTEFVLAVEHSSDISWHYGYSFVLTLTACLQAFCGVFSFLGAQRSHVRQVSRPEADDQQPELPG